MMLNDWMAIRKSDSFIMDGGIVVPIPSDSLVLLGEVVESCEGSRFKPGMHVLYMGNSQPDPLDDDVVLILEAFVVRILEKQ